MCEAAGIVLQFFAMVVSTAGSSTDCSTGRSKGCTASLKNPEAWLPAGAITTSGSEVPKGCQAADAMLGLVLLQAVRREEPEGPPLSKDASPSVGC